MDNSHKNINSASHLNPDPQEYHKTKLPASEQKP